MNLGTGSDIDGRYTIESLLGKGGMATVYRVRHNQLGSSHALKILDLPAASIRARLLAEGRLQATLRHRNIVAVTDVVEVAGAPGLIMELIEGPSLESLLERHRLTMDQADQLAQGIIDGVSAAHHHGRVHRDLKPANVMLQVTKGGLIPKVADFGLAKALTAEGESVNRTRSGLAMGTPPYMAPEQIRDAKNVDHRADVFSLGAILYELVCGQRAFGGADMLAIFNNVTNAVFTPPHELAPDLPERMERAILGALQVERDERISGCDELLALWKGEVWEPESAALEPVGPWSGTILADASTFGSGERIEAPAAPALPEDSLDTFHADALPEPTAVPSDLRIASAGSSGGPLTISAPLESSPPETDSLPSQGSAPHLTVMAPVAPTASSVSKAQAAQSPEGEAPRKRSLWGLLAVGLGVVLLVPVAIQLSGEDPVSTPEPAAEPVIAPASAASAPLEVTPAEPTEAATLPAADEAVAPTEAAPTEAHPAAAPAEAPKSAASKSAASKSAASKPVAPRPASKTSEPRAASAKQAAQVAPPAEEPKAEPAEPEAPAEMIGSFINSRPFGNVTIDGKPVGRTVWKGELSVGTHSVTITTTDGLTHSGTFLVRKGGDNRYCWDFSLGARCAR